MAIFSKRSLEGELLIDHRNSPGISEEFMRKNNLSGPAVGAGVTYESAVCVCHCCQRDIVLNPKRSRERAWCWKHDAYLCDDCGEAQKSGLECVPFVQRLERYYQKLTSGVPLKEEDFTHVHK